MNPETAKAELKRITDEAIGVGGYVEATNDLREYYIYTECWTLSIEQLDLIRAKVNITAITAEGGTIKLTARI